VTRIKSKFLHPSASSGAGDAKNSNETSDLLRREKVSSARRVSILQNEVNYY